MDTIRINIKAVAKGRPRFKMQGNFPIVYTDKKTKDFENSLANIVKKEIKIPFNSILSMKLEVFLSPPISWSKKKKTEALNSIFKDTKPDIDNYIKSVMDSLNGVLYKDDCQVVELYATKKYAEEDYILISYKELEQ